MRVFNFRSLGNFRETPHQSSRQERFNIILPLANDDVLLSFVGLVQPEPHPPKVNFLQKAFTDVLPRRVMALSAGRAEGRPVAVVKKDLQAALLRNLARFNVEYDDPRLCSQRLDQVARNVASTYDMREVHPSTCGCLHSSVFHRPNGPPH